MSYVQLSSVQSDASGGITATRARVYDIYGQASGTAGFIKLRDGGSTGNVLFEATTPATDKEAIRYELPRYGIPFKTNLYMELSNINSMTLVLDGTINGIRTAGGDWIHDTDGSLIEPAA